MLGWARYSGDPNTKLDIQLWAYNQATGAWTQMTTTTADKWAQHRNGAAGVCGPGTNDEAVKHHGFEAPVHPDFVLSANSTFSIHAYHAPTGAVHRAAARAIALSVAPSDLRHLAYRPKSQNNKPALLSCIWPFLGANSERWKHGSAWINPGGRPHPARRHGHHTIWVRNHAAEQYAVHQLQRDGVDSVPGAK